MGSRYPVLPPEKVIKVLMKMGFVKVSQRGSHVKFKNAGQPSRTVIVPMHNELARGTLRGILEQAGVTLEEFLNDLDRI
ncbi:MAG: type II toxin-antitoxin system HicA family toxin [Bacillota bacterium]